MRMRRRAVGAICLSLVALGIGATAAAASGHHPPRLTLKAGARSTDHYNLRGQWWDHGPSGCGAIAIDPAPAPPRALPVRSARQRSTIVYHTAAKPRRVALRVARRGEAHLRHARLHARRDAEGEPRAWVLVFSARVGSRLNVFPFARWRDRRGCGTEYLEAHFRLRGQPGGEVH